jgi:hypothetical protein
VPPVSVADIRIWGWSKNGKVAYSVAKQFVILNTVNDTIEFSLANTSDHAAMLDAMDKHNIWPYTGQAEYNFLKAGMYSQYFGDHHTSDYELGSMISNIKSYTADPFVATALNSNELVISYDVTITQNGKSKVIASFTPLNSMTARPSIVGAIQSPYENRLLVIIAEKYLQDDHSEIVYRFSGCHLGVGFN